MWRKILIATIVGSAAVVSGAGAQFPLPGDGLKGCDSDGEPAATGSTDISGFFDGAAKHDLADPDRNAAGGLLPLAGWAVALNEDIESVFITVDGRPVDEARYGVSRGDIAALFNSATYPDANAAGFVSDFDTSRFVNGPYTLGALVITASGKQRNLNQVDFLFQNSVHDLGPFGDIDQLPQGFYSGNCDLSDPDRTYTVFTGFVLDPKVAEPGGSESGGIHYVEFFLNGGRLRNTRTDCTHDPDRGAFSDCYGVRRDDIAKIFPTHPNASHSGFRFVLDIGRLIGPIDDGGVGYRPGQHRITIRAGDQGIQSNDNDDIGSINVNFVCEDFFDNQPAFGHIDESPFAGTLSGTVTFEGWALDREEVREVRITVDGEDVGAASYGFFRPQVSSDFPGFPDSLRPGWMFILDTSRFSDGRRVVGVDVEDEDGDVNRVAERTFVFENK